MHFSSINSFNQLPNRFWLQVFFHLDHAKTLGICACVNKQWNSVSSDNQLWISLFPFITKRAHVKKYIGEKCIKSYEELAQRINRFNISVKDGCEGNFLIAFPLNPQFKINIDYSSIITRNSPSEYTNETAFFITKLPDVEPIGYTNCIYLDSGPHNKAYFSFSNYEFSLLLPKSLQLIEKNNHLFNQINTVEHLIKIRMKKEREYICTCIAS